MLVEVEGICMLPYLMDRDHLWVEPLPSALRPGQLILAQKKDTQEKLVHRVIKPGHPGLTKGDRTRQFDHVLAPGIEPLGLVTARILPGIGEDAGGWVPYTSKWIRAFHRLQAFLSAWNRLEYPGINKLAAAGLILCGTSLRFLENSWFRKRARP